MPFYTREPVVCSAKTDVSGPVCLDVLPCCPERVSQAAIQHAYGSDLIQLECCINYSPVFLLPLCVTSVGVSLEGTRAVVTVSDTNAKPVSCMLHTLSNDLHCVL